MNIAARKECRPAGTDFDVQAKHNTNTIMIPTRLGCNLVFILASLTAPVLHSQPAEMSGTEPALSPFQIRFDTGAIVSLRNRGDTIDTDYIQGRRLGDAVIQFREQRSFTQQPGTNDWQTIQTAQLKDHGAFVLSSDGKLYQATYRITNGTSATLALTTKFSLQDQALVWTMTLQNVANQPLEIGDLALPLPIGARPGRRGGGGAGGGTNNTAGGTGQRGGANAAVVLKHSFISGNGSFFFWMREARSAIVGPYLTMVPLDNTSLAYWETGLGSYGVIIHSAVSGTAAKARGTNWRQPLTSLTLAPKGKSGDTRTYQFKLRWANDYEGVRQILVDEGKVDVQVVPGMTLPNDLSAKFALRTKQRIKSV